MPGKRFYGKALTSLVLTAGLMAQSAGAGAILVSADNGPQGVNDTPDRVTEATPEDVGESIKEIVQAVAELGRTDVDGEEIARLVTYIDETKEQFEELPQEGQDVLQESYEALENADVFAETFQDAYQQAEETGTVVSDPDGLENSFRYMNGVLIDESLIAVEEELEAARTLDPEELSSDEPSGEDDEDGAGTDDGGKAENTPAESGTGDGNTQSGSSERESAGEETDSGAEADLQGQADAPDADSPGGPSADISDEPSADTSGEPSADTSDEPAADDSGKPSVDASGGSAADLSEGSSGTSGDPAGDNAGNETADPSGSKAAADPVSLKTAEEPRPKANIALVRTDTQSRMVSLAEAKACAAAGSDVHLGIDVSHHNGVIDWDAVKAAGIEFVIIRCGHGHNLETGGDNYWLRNISEVERVGLPYGVYFYSYATTVAGAKAEAAATVKLLKGHKPSLPVFFDMEDGTQKYLGSSTICEIAQAYCGAVAAAGYKPGFYSYKYWLESFMGSFLQKTDYPVWVAQYSAQATYAGDYVAWQYTSSGYVDGIAGRVDMNKWYGAMKAGAVSGSQAVSKLQADNAVKPDTSGTLQTTADAYTQQQITVTVNGAAAKKWIIVENATGNRVKNRFVYIPSLNKICYFDKDGYKVFGEKKIGSKWYLFDSEARGGAMLVGFQYVSGKNKICYYNEKGRRVSGKKKIGKYWYYFSAGSGKMLRNSFKTIKKKKCYYDTYGHAVSGEKKIGKYWYYFSPDSFAMKTGLRKVAGTNKTCYYNSKGRRQSGLKKIKGNWYYFKPSNGAMLKDGFKKIKNKKYYFNSKGRRVYGTQLIRGKWYTFSSSGALIG